jgi:NADH:ubiquinone oxidoreductase subunit D
VLARSTGLLKDLRLSYNETYANYYYLNIRSFFGQNGDCYDRYLIRMREMIESVNIISQVTNIINLSNKNIQKKSFTKSKNYFFSYLDYLNSYNLSSNKRFKQST